jgi:hypothetical protein
VTKPLNHVLDAAVMMKAFTAIFAASLVCATAAEAATVKEQIGIFISTEAQRSDSVGYATMRSLLMGSIAYVENNGIADLEAVGNGAAIGWRTGGSVMLGFWASPNRTDAKVLNCRLTLSVTTCEIR